MPKSHSDLLRHILDVEWKAMARMRDRLIHHYFGVDYALVWDTIQEDIPLLKAQVTEIIKAKKDRV